MGASGSKDSKKLSNSANEKPLFSESKKSSSAKQSNQSNDPPSSSSSSSATTTTTTTTTASDLLLGKQKELSRTKREQEEPAPRSSDVKRKRVEELPIQPESQLFPSASSRSSLPVVVDRCKKSKKRRDPQLSASQSVLPFESSSSLAAKSSSSSKTESNPPVKAEDIEEGTLFQDAADKHSSTRKSSTLSPPSSSLKSKSQKPAASPLPSSGADSSLDSSKKQDSLLAASSSKFSQHSTISQASILRQLDALPRAAVQSSTYWLTPFLQSEFAGENDAHSENVEVELTRILCKVFVGVVC